MLARTPEQRKPYRLDSRQALSSQPPFTPALVRELLVKALAGPKGRVAQIVIEEQAISKLVGTLNHRHAAFVAAQADRARAARRAHLIWLFAELRKALPEVIRDIEEQKLKVGDFFACATEKSDHEAWRGHIILRHNREGVTGTDVRSNFRLRVVSTQFTCRCFGAFGRYREY